MHSHTERRTGTDRRQFDLSSTTIPGPEWRWIEASPGGFMAGDGDDPYDPYDPYWEPVKDQDDD